MENSFAFGFLFLFVCFSFRQKNKGERTGKNQGVFLSLNPNYYYYYYFYHCYYHIPCHIIEGIPITTTLSPIILRSEKAKPCSFAKPGRARHYVTAKGQLRTEYARSYMCYM